MNYNITSSYLFLYAHITMLLCLKFTIYLLSWKTHLEGWNTPIKTWCKGSVFYYHKGKKQKVYNGKLKRESSENNRKKILAFILKFIFL